MSKEIDTECPECGSEMELFDYGYSKYGNWKHYRCLECGNEESNEPDWDDMPGGWDYERERNL